MRGLMTREQATIVKLPQTHVRAAPWSLQRKQPEPKLESCDVLATYKLHSILFSPVKGVMSASEMKSKH